MSIPSYLFFFLLPQLISDIHEIKKKKKVKQRNFFFSYLNLVEKIKIYVQLINYYYKVIFKSFRK